MFTGAVRFDAVRTSRSFDERYLALPLQRDERALRGSMLKRALPLTVLQYRRDRLLGQRVRELLRTQAASATNAMRWPGCCTCRPARCTASSRSDLLQALKKMR